MASLDASEVKKIITSLLTSTPIRCTIRQLCADFRNIVGVNIPFRKLGFKNAEDYLRSIPDTVHIIGSGDLAEVQGVVSEKSAHINSLVVKQKNNHIPAHKRKNPKGASIGKIVACTNQLSLYEDEYRSRIPKRVQNNLRKLIMRFPQGIWCRQLASEYRKMFKEELDYEKFRFRSLIEMCSDLDEIFYYIQPNSSDFKLFDRNKTIPNLNQNDINVNTENHLSDLDWSQGSDLVPPDIVNFSEVIPQFRLDDIQAGDYLYLSIGEIYNTDHFWVFPKYGDLNRLLSQLELTLSNSRNCYSICDLFLQVGLYCSVFYKNKYHRAVITDLTSKIQVLFIDYGSVGEVNRDHIWFLPKQFGEFPCQAIKARLANIATEGDTKLTLNKFRELITGAEIVAEVINLNQTERVLDLYLANVSNGENIFYVNDALVEKGYAKYC